MPGERSILLVEDAPTDALLIQGMVEQALGPSARVTAVDRLAAGIECLRAGRYDLLLVDLSLPDSTGLETLRALRAAAPDLAIVVLTNSDDPVLSEEAIREGAQDYLVKGRFGEELLRRTLRYAYERRRLELQARRRAEDVVLRTITEGCADGMILLDERRHVVYANPAARRMLGGSPAGAPLGFPVLDGATVAIGGDRPDAMIEMRVAEMEYAGRPSRLVSLRDVTERMQMEMQIRQSQKMEAVGRLAGGVAHDFNNLLTVLLGRAELLKHKLDPQDPKLDDVNLLYGVGERAAVLTRQLLSFSRQRVDEPKTVQVNDLAASLVKMLRRIVPEKIELVLHLDPEAPKVCADPGQIDQVLMNLIINARDAIAGDGTIRVETAPATLDSDATRGMPKALPGAFLRLTVLDDGCGMDAETARHIFEPFFTTKSVGHGTGLGLATAYGIVEQCGGVVRVETAPGRGARFDVFLPVSGDPLALEFGPEDLRREMGGSETVLVVDDDAAVAGMVCETLGGCGYRTLLASRAQEALELAGAHAIDVLVTDLVMPEMNGTELARRILELRPEIRVLYVSGYTEVDATPAPFHGKRSGFLQKAFTPRSLLVKMRELLRPL
ncbi:MAG: response regulator [Planctomycetota bacterium]|nr:response regulator [Planctomycetota bacterium]